MQDIVFYIFSVLAVGCGLMLLLTHNPVTSAMFLVLAIVSLAGLFVLLHAFFLAAVQVLVYAGAVIVLFLFVIMLLDLKAEQQRRIKKTGAVLAVISVGAVAFILISRMLASPITTGAGEPVVQGGTAALGKLLFSQYLLPFEIVSILLLVAMIGAILLSKKELR